MINTIKEDCFSEFRANIQVGQPRLQSTFVGSFLGILRLSPNMAQPIQPVVFALLGVSISHASRATSKAAPWVPLVSTEAAFPTWNDYSRLIPCLGISYSGSNNSEGILNLVSVSLISILPFLNTIGAVTICSTATAQLPRGGAGGDQTL